MLGKDGRLYDSDFDFDGDGKLNAYEYSVMDDVVFGHEDTDTKKKLQANLKAINNDFNTVIFADIEVKFKLMELDAIRILIDDCERLINEDAGK